MARKVLPGLQAQFPRISGAVRGMAGIQDPVEMPEDADVTVTGTGFPQTSTEANKGADIGLGALTGLGMASVFGPAGLLVGGLVGWMQRQERNKQVSAEGEMAEEYLNFSRETTDYLEEQEDAVISGMNKGFDPEAQALAWEDGLNKLQQIKQARLKLQQAERVARSSNPAVRQAGLTLVQQAQDVTRAFVDQNYNEIQAEMGQYARRRDNTLNDIQTNRVLNFRSSQQNDMDYGQLSTMSANLRKLGQTDDPVFQAQVREYILGSSSVPSSGSADSGLAGVVRNSVGSILPPRLGALAGSVVGLLEKSKGLEAFSADEVDILLAAVHEDRKSRYDAVINGYTDMGKRMGFTEDEMGGPEFVAPDFESSPKSTEELDAEVQAGVDYLTLPDGNQRTASNPGINYLPDVMENVEPSIGQWYTDQLKNNGLDPSRLNVNEKGELVDIASGLPTMWQPPSSRRAFLRRMAGRFVVQQRAKQREYEELAGAGVTE